MQPDTALSHESFTVLHVARIKGLVPDDLLEKLASPGTIEALESQELIRRTRRGLLLTPSGLERHSSMLASEQESADMDTIANSYDRFLTVNAPVKGVCAAWQRSEGDEEALWHTGDLLGQYVGRARPSLRRAGEVLPRFSGYLTRLDSREVLASNGLIHDEMVGLFRDMFAGRGLSPIPTPREYAARRAERSNTTVSS